MTDGNEMHEELEGALNDFAINAAAPLRAPVYITEGFQSRTMAALRRDSPLARLMTPRAIRISPLAGLAMAAGLIVAAALGSAAVTRHISAPVASAATVIAPDTVHIVRFQLAAPGAHTVALVGDFNDWSRDAIILKPAEKAGVWTASVPLGAGRHEYAFIVDGKRWVADPYAATHRDEYDVESSVIRVGESGS